MLYVTTTDNAKTYSPEQVLHPNDSANDGYYVPLQLPVLDSDIIRGSSANDTVAHLLNLFFSTHLTGRDVDLAIGKFPVRLFHMNHRISVIESWHNLEWDFSRMVKNLTAQIQGSRDTEQPLGVWPQIAIRAAVICGAYTQMQKDIELLKGDCFDIAVPSGDFSCAMSAWLCKQLGIPIHNIVVCCNDNNNLWEFFNHGELRTGRTPVLTDTPECDKTVAELIEMLINFHGTASEAIHFKSCCRDGRIYFPHEDVFRKMADGFYVSVIGQARTETTILGAYSTHGYVLGPYSALTYAGALDYRARTGENRHIMILSEKGALLHDKYVAKALGTTVTELHHILDS